MEPVSRLNVFALECGADLLVSSYVVSLLACKPALQLVTSCVYKCSVGMLVSNSSSAHVYEDGWARLVSETGLHLMLSVRWYVYSPASCTATSTNRTLDHEQQISRLPAAARTCTGYTHESVSDSL